MTLLSLIHRWTGGLIGLLLGLLGLSGAILVWEGDWIGLHGARDPVVEQVTTLGAISLRAVDEGAKRITFASEELGLHHVAGPNGSGSYVQQDGSVVDRWSSQWERPEAWLFDFHHHLFAGESGEAITGIAGLCGLFFVVTGSILWWRSRRAFEFRLWPRKLQPGPVVRHHRDVGILVAPVLLVSLISGVGMVYGDAARVLVGGTKVGKPPQVEILAGDPQVTTMLETAKIRFPDAALRRFSVPAKPGSAFAVRMRQPDEWTPNGRTTLYFDPSGRLLRVDNPMAGASGDALIEKLYPVHSGKVGGLPWKLAMTLSGLALALLGSLAVWSFWFRKATKRKPKARAPSPIKASA